MTATDSRAAAARTRALLEASALPRPHRADGATVGVVFVVVLMIVPARLVYRGLSFAITPAESIGLFALVWWLCAHFTSTLGAAKGRTLVRSAVFVHAASLLATYAYATAGPLPRDEVELADHMLVTAFAMIGVVLLVVDGVRGRDRLDLVLKTVAVMGAVLGVVGAVQFLFTFDPTKYMVLPGLRYTQEELFILERNGLSRVAATTGHPIEFAVMCAMILPIALHFAFQARERGGPALRWWVCAGLIGAGMVFSVSRSAFVGLAGAAVVLLAGWPKVRRLLAAGAVLVFLGAVKLVVPGVLGAIVALFTNISNDSSLRWRTMDYAAATTEIGRHPWLGRGLGTWYAPKYLVFDNQYILTTVETGIIGVLAFAGLFAAGIWSALRARRLLADAASRDLGLTLAACLVVPLIGAATFDLRAYAVITGLSFLLVGAAGALLREARDARAAPPGGPADRARPAGGAGEAGLSRADAPAPPSTSPPPGPAR
ncbi:O-antigen ligase family protein [Nonomuraea roseoviolacea]|uniref:O-antigen ligase n=1 Tax=Nonomuraea roseoviolacea subsp. carminata TaxID=160689 RepID=A0ABT1JZK5_9ACTN|nr:O-antigen ligase family protein [Nonomuraea roseoviolacea]MCP2346686.1 O-antigen ligase [Nonomuraea roseoviolacea subsp. carminata]